MPRLPTQTELYRRVLDTAGGRPVVFRTLDLGGDKMLPYATPTREENPALGWRALRIALDRPALLRYQIRALLAAAENHPLSIMFPMVAEVSEFERAKALVEREVLRRQRLGKVGPPKVRIGAMLEVPSLVWQLDGLCKIADFVSVGSNDLQQFFFASDRGNTRLAGRYDPLSPALLRLLKHIAQTCSSHGVSLSLCGEMAGKPLESMALIGLGFRAVSMQPAGIGPVKMMIRSLPLEKLQAALGKMLDSSAHSLREPLQDFATREGVAI